MQHLRRPELWTFVTVLIFGGILALMIPPAYGQDEPVHMMRIWQIAHGQSVGHDVSGSDAFESLFGFSTGPAWGGATELSVIRLIKAVHLYPLSWSQMVPSEHASQIDWSAVWSLPSHEAVVDAGFYNVAIYSPIAYLPQTFTVMTGTAIGLPVVAIVYLARLAGVIFSAGAAALSVRLAGGASATVLAVIACLPVTVAQSAVLGADAVVNSLALLSVALVVRSIRAESDAHAWNASVWAGVALTALVLSKSAYAPLTALLIVVPLARRARSRTWVWLGVSGAALAVLPAVLWQTVVNAGAPNAYQGEVGLHQKLDRLVSDPTGVLTASVRTWIDPLSLQQIGEQFAGSAMWNSVRAPLWTLVVLGLLLGVSYGLHTVTHSFPLPASVAVAGIAIATLGIVTLSMYIAFAPVDAEIVTGVQGRYLIPIAALTALPVVFRSQRGSSMVIALTGVAALTAAFTAEVAYTL